MRKNSSIDLSYTYLVLHPKLWKGLILMQPRKGSQFLRGQMDLWREQLQRPRRHSRLLARARVFCNNGARFHERVGPSGESDVPRLGVNIDHVATLRQARGGIEPDPVAAAVLVELAGADGVVLHLREDRRHIQDRDLTLLREIVQTKLDLEMAPEESMAKIALTVKPHLVTLVPERRQELTTEGGLEVAGQKDRLQKLVTLLHDGGIPVSLFIEPDLNQVKAAHKVSADYIEIHTGRYANARRLKEEQSEFETIAQAAKLAFKLGMGVNAGHGLTYRNVKRLTQIPEIVEYNIGHSIVARAVLVGLDRAVREMKQLLG
jgi:pyridoxine 5-phosphate synthase